MACIKIKEGVVKCFTADGLETNRTKGEIRKTVVRDPNAILRLAAQHLNKNNQGGKMQVKQKTEVPVKTPQKVLNSGYESTFLWFSGEKQ